MIITGLNLEKEYWRNHISDITTEAIWISSKADKYQVPDRGFSNNQDFHGIFIHEIPYQMINRYTKENETIWDCFAGTGTTYEVATHLNRKYL